MRLVWDPATNMLRLSLTETVAVVRSEARSCTLDVAANGRLVGIELRGPDLTKLLSRWTADPSAAEFTHLSTDDSAYIELSAGPSNDEIRSSTVAVVTELDADAACLALAIPRRGAGYEIAYPSGNR